MKKKIIILLLPLMFFFKPNHSSAENKNFYDLKINDISGKTINFDNYRNKVVLIVNTASYCGFTKQYADLQILWDKYKSSGLIVIGIPSNSFNQEKKNNKEVREFCEFNFNIDFILSEISDVKGENAHDIYKWAKNVYGKSAVPKWNFHKILVDKNGQIIETFVSFTSPLSNKIIQAIEKSL